MITDMLIYRIMRNEIRRKNLERNKVLLIEDIKKEKKEKKVSFYNVVKVVLIPNIKDYIDSNLVDNIWWSDNDYYIFKINLIKERNIKNSNCIK